MVLDRTSFVPEEFAQLRALLQQAGYTPAGLVERTGSAIMDERVANETTDLTTTDALDVLLRLFWNGETLPAAVVRGIVPAELNSLLERLGLCEHDAGSGTICAPLALYPVRSIYIVSDQRAAVVGKDAQADAVYPALTGSTVEFLGMLSTTPCDSLLDLGSGTGVAALLGAQQYARHAWAIDIAERSTRMAAYNARLNGIDNVTVLRGDLYEPVAGLTFDRIVAHPPFMPRLQTELIFGDGGADGEEITCRIVAGLVDHLRPGGRFTCRCMASDRKDAPLEQRLRTLLGDAASEFDIALMVGTTMPASRCFGQLLERGDMTPAAYQQLMQLLTERGVENVVLGTVAIERHEQERAAVTVRRQLAPHTAAQPQIIDWLLQWERTATESEFGARLLDSRPVVSEHAEIRLAHRMANGTLRAHACHVVTHHPFEFTLDSSPGLALLLGRCDGTRTCAELLDEMKQAGALPDELPVADFLRLLRLLIGGYVLVLPEYSLHVGPATAQP